jgi:DNA (cytosine-5)-methyltransferase 1
MYQLHFGKVRKGRNGICRTLTASMGGLKLHKPIVCDDFGIRYLSPKECLLLQGFPNTFNFPNTIKLDSAYSQVGNTVCVPLVKRIAENIKDLFKGEDNG